MVGILIAFCINNIIWGVILVYVICLLQNKSLPKLIKRKRNDLPEDEYEEATDEQIQAHFDKIRKQSEEIVFDGSGNRTNVNKEERAVD